MDVDWESVRDEVIAFMNEFIQRSELPLTVSRIDDDVYRRLQRRNGELDWDWAIQYLNDDGHFDLAIGIRLNDEVDGVAIGLYQREDKVLEIKAIESFVRFDDEHPLSRRMCEFTVIAAVYFVMSVHGDGVHIVDPIDERLISYYEQFGFIKNAAGQEIRMEAGLDILAGWFRDKIGDLNA